VLIFHYLWGKSRSFRFSYGFGLFCSGELLGTCVFARFPYPELVNTLFGLPRWDQKGFYELSRLCLNPLLQKERGKNFSSRLVAHSIRQLRKTTPVRAIFSYADSERHIGTVYQALNFRYLGLTDPKYDYWEVDGLAEPRRVTRGAVSGRGFKKIPRSRKHRYVQVFDNSLSLGLPVLPNPRRELTVESTARTQT
jgi:hypothetical protein